ncbi:Zn-dependent protease (includes SpoIVFB) [Methylobacterium phyllostachyos]|uniref:Zn-dependent protease (Includes SpoIVFB) n=2 Tax=Methylobacterium phyllostachyos TaxID=582672 RepID=A0A1G9WUX6_9HYPH|nr:Zn-dependent protease (includes SpoIVFB) [Methylobacterium phyllostachyos]
MSAWLLSLCLHEFGHAWVAWKGGDDAILETGYLTLDPRHYIDPMFSVVMPMIFLMIGGIGFPGGSVLINRARLRSRAWQSAMSAAGPAMNGLFLIALMAFYQLCSEEAEGLRLAIAAAAFVQCTALVLNLLPIPGLDGYGILQPWLPDTVQAIGGKIAVYSGVILVGLFLVSSSFGQALSRAGFAMAIAAGFEHSDIVFGCHAMRLW